MRGFPLLFVFVLAGCTDPAPMDVSGPEPATDGGSTSMASEAGDQALPAATPTNDTARTFERTFALSLSEMHTLGRTSMGTNCVHVRGAPFEILGGSIEATWTAQSAMVQQLEVTILEFFGDHRLTHEGPSPLHVAFGGLPPADEGAGNEPDEFYAFAIQMQDPGLAYDQEVTLTLAFEYRSDAVPVVDEAGCALG